MIFLFLVNVGLLYHTIIEINKFYFTLFNNPKSAPANANHYHLHSCLAKPGQQKAK